MYDAFLGSLLLVPYTGWAPLGWALCNGAMLPISQNTALFSLIGTTFGGDGISTFALPNMNGDNGMKDASGAPLYWVIAIQGIFPQRQ